jgi:hypothetical protein
MGFKVFCHHNLTLYTRGKYISKFSVLALKKDIGFELH